MHRKESFEMKIGTHGTGRDSFELPINSEEIWRLLCYTIPI